MTIASYATLLNRDILRLSSKTRYVAVDRDHLIWLMRPTLQLIYVDSEWYLSSNPDIAEAVANGTVDDARDHYVRYGYYEHRMPYQIDVEESWYLAHYPDVKEAVATGAFSSGRDHFYAVGFAEGRLPCANFALRLMQ